MTAGQLLHPDALIDKLLIDLGSVFKAPLLFSAPEEVGATVLVCVMSAVICVHLLRLLGD